MSAHMADLSISQGTVSYFSVFSKKCLPSRAVLLCMMTSLALREACNLRVWVIASGDVFDTTPLLQVHQKESSRPSGGSPQKQSTPLNIPARQSSLEAARHAVDPSNSPGTCFSRPSPHSQPLCISADGGLGAGSGPVYRGRLSRRKSSFDSNSNNLEGSPSEAGSYQGRYSGMNSIGKAANACLLLLYIAICGRHHSSLHHR